MNIEKKKDSLKNTCDFAGVRPVMMELPYPPIRVESVNPAYAGVLSFDYCGAVSELSAITQYINNESRLADKNCAAAKTILGIAMAEMMHLQKLGELIQLLGGKVDYTARHKGGKQRLWTPAYVTLADHPDAMLRAGVESEQAAINQYRMHMKVIGDSSVNAVLARIIQDEEYHIMILQALADA